MAAAAEINRSISLLWEDTCWTALILPSSLSAASRYASPIVCLFLFCPLKYGHKFTKGLVLPDPGEVPSLSGKTLWKYQREARCHINTVMISPEFLPRAGVTRKQRKWWHILTQDPGKSNPDILFRARDSSSANYCSKRRACFSQCRLRLRSLPKQPRQWSSGPKGTIYIWTRAASDQTPSTYGHGWRQKKRERVVNTVAISPVFSQSGS